VQKMLKGHLPRVIYHQVYKYTKKKSYESRRTNPGYTCTRACRETLTRGLRMTSTKSLGKPHTKPSLLLLLYSRYRS